MPKGQADAEHWRRYSVDRAVPAWVAAATSVTFGIQSWRSSQKSKAEREEATRQAERAERAVSAAARTKTRTANATEPQPYAVVDVVSPRRDFIDAFFHH
jgi:hypothetical protein